MYSPDTHTRINVQLPYSVPGCQEPYEAWNAGYESCTYPISLAGVSVDDEIRDRL